MSVDFVGLPSMFYSFISFVRNHIAGIAGIADVNMGTIAMKHSMSKDKLIHIFV